MVNRSSVEEKKSTVRSHQVLECYYMTSAKPCCFAEHRSPKPICKIWTLLNAICLTVDLVSESALIIYVIFLNF